MSESILVGYPDHECKKHVVEICLGIDLISFVAFMGFIPWSGIASCHPICFSMRYRVTLDDLQDRAQYPTRFDMA